MFELMGAPTEKSIEVQRSCALKNIQERIPCLIVELRAINPSIPHHYRIIGESSAMLTVLFDLLESMKQL